jgi:DNA modification methylase
MKTNQIYHGDCLDLMPSIPSKSVDMILCDLPYGTTACEWDSIIDMGRLWEQYERVIKDNGNIILTSQGMFTAKLMVYKEAWFNHDYVWIKNIQSNFALTGYQPHRIFENVLVFRPPRKEDLNIQFNLELRTYSHKILSFINMPSKKICEKLGNRKAEHFFYYNSSQFGLCTKETYQELIEHFKIDQMQGFLNYETLQSMNPPFTFNFDDRIKSTKQKIKANFDIRMYGDTNKKETRYVEKAYENYPRNTLYFDREIGLHPTQKPVSLFEYLIRTYSNENEVVLDNCSGSGTTAIACLNSNRQYICIEKDEAYYKRSLERVANHEPLLNLQNINEN